MANNGEIVIESGGKQYGATYSVSGGMLLVKTHTETRSIEINGKDPEALARSALSEIVRAQSAG